MMQTKFYIQRGVIIGLLLHNSKKRWKQCTWCNHHFLPHHNKQVYCDKTCKRLQRQKYKRDWNYRRRILEREGHVINDKAILNVGTGGLGEHPCSSFAEEIRRIKHEKRRLRL